MEHFLYLAKRVSQIIMQRHSQATDKVRQHWLAVGRQRAFHFDHFISFHFMQIFVIEKRGDWSMPLPFHSCLFLYFSITCHANFEVHLFVTTGLQESFIFINMIYTCPLSLHLCNYALALPVLLVFYIFFLVFQPFDVILKSKALPSQRIMLSFKL